MAVVLVLVVLLCSVEGWLWGRRRRRGRGTASVRANVGNNRVPSVSGSVGYKKNNWEVKGTGTVDMNGNWRAGVGATWRFKKRDMQVCMRFGYTMHAISIHEVLQGSGGSKGDSWGSLESPFETKLLHFHGEFSEKSGKITNNWVQSTNRTPFVNLNPLPRNSGSAPARLS